MRIAVLLFVSSFTLWGDAPVIQQVRFEGTRRRPAIDTKPGQLLDPARISQDVRRLWATGLFDDIRVESDGAAVVFHVVEKTRFRLNEVQFEPGSERHDPGLKKGTLLEPADTGRIAAALRTALQQDGYPQPNVSAALVPIGGERANLRLSIEPGKRIEVGRVTFSGRLGLDQAELNKALRSTASKTMIPGLWKHRPPFSGDAVSSDLARVRSALIKNGYFDAQVRLDHVDQKGKQADIAMAVDSGARYQVRQLEIVDLDKALQFSPARGRELCRCLFDLRRAAQNEGRLDFEVRLKAEDSPAPDRAVDLSARIQAGPPYRVGRIEFTGNRSFRDSTVRGAFLLDEGAIFDWALLDRSLERVNQLGFFEPLGSADIQVVRRPASGSADIRVRLKEQRLRRWSVSGPAGPARIGGPLQAAVMTRLPAWGRGILEASTYYVTFSVSAFQNPLLKALQLAPKNPLSPVIAVERPYIAGQRWQSGFTIAPQLGWRGVLASYGATQFRRGPVRILGGATQREPDIVAQVERPAAEGAELLCEPRRSRWSKLRGIAAMALELALSWRV